MIYKYLLNYVHVFSVFYILTVPQLDQRCLVNKGFPGVNTIRCSKSAEF